MADDRSRAKAASTARRKWVRPAARMLEAGKAEIHFAAGTDSTHGAS